MALLTQQQIRQELKSRKDQSDELSQARQGKSTSWGRIQARLNQIAERHGVTVTQEDLNRADDYLAQRHYGQLSDRDITECSVCNGFGFVKVDSNAVPGDKDYGRITPCLAPFHAQDQQRKQAKISGLSLEELNIRLDQLALYESDDVYHLPPDAEIVNGDEVIVHIPRRNVKMIQAFKDLASGQSDSFFVYVWGPHGGGKSTAGIALVNEINLGGKGPAMYITLPDLFQFLKDAFDDRNRDSEFGRYSESQRYDVFANTPVIVVDEFDFDQNKVSESGYNVQMLQRFVNERYRSGKDGKTLTVFLSNSPVNHVGLSSIVSRLKDTDCKIIINSAPDFREMERVLQ